MKLVPNQESISAAFAAFKKVEEQKAEKEPEGQDITASSVPVRAKLNYTAVGVCPYCNRPMSRTMCCEQEVFLCEDDRFVSPLPNEEIA